MLLITYILLSLSLIIYFAYKWGTTAIKEYKWGHEDGMREYQERIKAFAQTHPTRTAEELYILTKLNFDDEKGRQD